jgi:hypothetical protein
MTDPPSVVNSAYFSAFFGLLGATIGGLTSITTAWLTQRTERRENYRHAEKAKRETLYGDFISEASRLYGDALSHEKDDVTSLVQLYAIIGKLRLFASRDVLVAAETAMDAITATYLAPNRNLRELQVLAHEGGMNFLLEFGEACRRDLEMDIAAPSRPIQ